MTHENGTSGGVGSTGGSLVLQRRYLPAEHIPKSWTEWHDHPEPHQIAWGPGRFETLEENIKNACRIYYMLSKKVEYRMVRRRDETVWEYSANSELSDSASEGPRSGP